MFKLVSSMFKYLLWFVAVLLVFNFTQERGLIERCALLTAAVIVIDALMLVIELVRGAIKSTKRVGGRLRKQAQAQALSRAEKRGARRERAKLAAKAKGSKQPEDAKQLFAEKLDKAVKKLGLSSEEQSEG